MIKIALLDSGIDSMKHNVASNLIFIGSDVFDQFGHGTMCYRLLAKRIICPCEFYILKVLDNRGKTNVKTLITALEHLIDADVNIINMSLSVTEGIERSDEDELLEVCNQLKANNKFVICSLLNGAIQSSIPGSFPSVYGVRGVCMPERNCYWIKGKDNIELCADKTPCLLTSLHNRRQFFSGNSKACAEMTGILANLIFQNKDINVDELLRTKATKCYYSNKQVENFNEQFFKYDQIEKGMIDISLFRTVKKLLIETLGAPKYHLKEFFSPSVDRNGIALRMIGDYVSIIDKIEKNEKIKFNNDTIQITDFYNIYHLCYAIQTRWKVVSKHGTTKDN